MKLLVTVNTGMDMFALKGSDEQRNYSFFSHFILDTGVFRQMKQNVEASSYE
jgi:hypothetical protein